MVMATAMPAMAKSWVICVDTTKDARFSTSNTFFVGAAPIYPGNTNVSAAADCSIATIGKSTFGTFFALGGLVAGLPGSTTSNPNDQFYVAWHFRIDGRGADSRQSNRHQSEQHDHGDNQHGAYVQDHDARGSLAMRAGHAYGDGGRA